MSSDHWELAFPNLHHGSRESLLDIYPEQDRSLDEIIVSGCEYKKKYPIEKDVNDGKDCYPSDVVDNFLDVILNSKSESDNFSQSTPKKLHSSSDKYRVSPKCDYDSFNQNEIANDSCISKTSENPKYSSTSSSDLLDKLSLIDVDTIGVSSLLSLPSPIKLESDENSVSIVCNNDKSAADISLVEEYKPSHTSSHNSSHAKSKIPIAVFKQSSFSSESPVSSLPSQLFVKESNNLASKVNSHKYFKDKLKNKSSSLSQPISYNDRSRKCSQGNGFRGRRCVSTLSLLDEKINADGGRCVANFPREFSQSEEELPKKAKDFRHVESKVKRYIDGIKSLDCSRRASPVRSSTDTPIDDLDFSDVFLLDENLVSIEGSESELPRSLSILVRKLNEGTKSPQLMRNILRILINERKLRTEQEQAIASLQLEYDNLLAKHAESKNLIDELRLQSDRGRSSENLTFNQLRGQSCYSTPVHRRYSIGDSLSGKLGKFSSSQPNLIKSTLFEVTHPSLGLSIDKTGDLHFLPSPFESKVSFPLTKNQPNASVNDYVKNLDRNGSLGKSEQHPHKADLSLDCSRKEGCNHSRTSSHTLEGSRYYVSLGQKLQDFSLLVSSDGLDSQEIQIVWRKLLTDFTDLCKSEGGQQTRELASLENAFGLLSKKFCLPFSIPHVKIGEQSNQNELFDNSSKLNSSVIMESQKINEIRSNYNVSDTSYRPFSSVRTDFPENDCESKVDDHIHPIKKSDDSTLKKDVESDDVLNIAFNIKDESVKESTRDVSVDQSGRVVGENGVVSAEVKVPRLFNLQYHQKPLTSHEKVEKWRASLQDVTKCPSDYFLSSNNREFQSLVSTERNELKDRKYSSCNNLHLSKRLDVDSGCQVSSGRSNLIKTVLDSNEEPCLEAEQSSNSLHGIASNFSPRSNCSLEVYPSHLKTKVNDVIPNGSQKYTTDIDTSLLRIEKDLDLLKRRLSQTEFNGKVNRQGRFKREPIKATKDYSFTSGSETESSYSFALKANHKINSRQCSDEESKQNNSSVLKLCKLQRTKYYSDLENENTRAKSISTKKHTKRSRSLPKFNGVCRNCHKNNATVTTLTADVRDDKWKEKEARNRRFEDSGHCCLCSEKHFPNSHDPKLLTELNSATLLASKLNSKSLEILNSLVKNYGKKRA